MSYPHSRTEVSKYNTNRLLNKPEQGPELQFFASFKLPTQSAPPLAGAGLLQLLSLVCCPSPQSAEHSDHSPKALNPPSTKLKKCVHQLHNKNNQV